jgi:hypothetical protein
MKMFSDKTAALKWLTAFYVMPGEKFELKKKKK